LQGNEPFVLDNKNLNTANLAKDIANLIDSHISDSLVVSSDFKYALTATVKVHKTNQLGSKHYSSALI